MHRNRRLAIAIIASSALALVMTLLSNVAAGLLTPAFANRPTLMWVALLGTFLLSLPLALYLAWYNPPPPQPSDSLPPPPYARFYGRETLLDDLMDVLREPGSRVVVGIDGLGGIGKTAVARQLVERSLSEKLFDAVIWEPRVTGATSTASTPLSWQSFVAAAGRQLGAPDIQRLSPFEQSERLAELMARTKTLLVLDNLETARTDQAEFAQRLAPLLLPAGKAILTSRRRFTGDVYAVHLRGLDEESSLQLARHEARIKGIQRVVSSSDEKLRSLARKTGGSPLAIKLLVGQLHHLPVDTVLASLENVHLDQMEPGGDEYIVFYKGIFWRSWRVLSREARLLLVSMSIFSPGLGGTLEMVTEISGLHPSRVSKRLDELWRASLIEVDSVSLDQTRYYLHPLTQYFVKSDIVKEE